jgi:hypothetical protein
MDESRFRVANVHHVYPRFVDGVASGHQCLCGDVMLTHRACTEHIVDAYRTDLYARMMAEAEVARLAPNGKHPRIAFMTHAAALWYAAKLIDGSR